MAHQLSLVKGKYEFVKFGEKAWHGLGTYIKEPMTTQQALEYANLTWHTNIEPLYLKRGDQFIESNQFKATIREDIDFHLGCVSPKYKVIQNNEVFQIVDDILMGAEAVIHTAGAINQGRRIFLTAKLPEYIEVNDEVIDQYLVITNSHTGDTALRIMFTPICVVCNNTLQMAINGSKKYMIIKHTKNASVKMKEVATILGIINSLSSELENLTNSLTQQINIEKYFKDVCEVTGLIKRKRINYEKAFLYSYNQGQGSQLEIRQGTAWGAYNAITHYYSNVKQYSNPERKFLELTEGADYSVMKTALNLAEMATL